MLATSTPEIKCLKTQAIEKALKKDEKAKRKLFAATKKSAEDNKHKTREQARDIEVGGPSKRTATHGEVYRSSKHRPTPSANKSTSTHLCRKPVKTKSGATMTKPRPVSRQPALPIRKPTWLGNLNKSGLLS